MKKGAGRRISGFERKAKKKLHHFVENDSFVSKYSYIEPSHCSFVIEGNILTT
jgi:hypothetical protein